MSQKKEAEEAIVATAGILIKCGKNLIDSLLYLDATTLDRQLVYHIMGEQHIFVAHENSLELACIIQKFLTSASRTPEEKKEAEKEQAQREAEKVQHAQNVQDELKEFMKTHAMPLPQGAENGTEAFNFGDLIMTNPLTRRGPVGASRAARNAPGVVAINEGPWRPTDMPVLAGIDNDTIIFPISDNTTMNQQINPTLANKKDVPIVTQPSYVPKRGRPRKNDPTRMVNVPIINRGVPQQVGRCPTTGRPVVIHPNQVYNMPIPGPAGRGAPIRVINANARTNMPILGAAGRGVPIRTPANANFNARTIANPGVAMHPIHQNQTYRPIPGSANPGVTIIPITNANTLPNANAGIIPNSTTIVPILQKANIAPPQSRPINILNVNNPLQQQLHQLQRSQLQQQQQQLRHPQLQQQQQLVMQPPQLHQQQQLRQPQLQQQQQLQHPQLQPQPQKLLQQPQLQQQQLLRQPQLQQQRQQQPQPQQQPQQRQLQYQQPHQQVVQQLQQQQHPKPPQMNFVRKLVKLDSKDMALITQLQNMKKQTLMKNQGDAQMMSQQATAKAEEQPASEVKEAKKPPLIDVQSNILIVPGIGNVGVPGNKRKRTNPAKPGMKPKVTPHSDNLMVKGVDDDVIDMDIDEPQHDLFGKMLDQNLKRDAAQINDPAKQIAVIPPPVHTCTPQVIKRNAPSGRGGKCHMHGGGVNPRRSRGSNTRGPNQSGAKKNAKQNKIKPTFVNWKKEFLESDVVPKVKFNIKQRPSQYNDNKPPLKCDTEGARKLSEKRKLAAKAKLARRLANLNLKAKSARMARKKAREMENLEMMGDLINENLTRDDEPELIPIVPPRCLPHLGPFVMPNFGERRETIHTPQTSPVNVIFDILLDHPSDEEREELTIEEIVDDEEEAKEADAKPEEKKKAYGKPEENKVDSKPEEKKKTDTKPVETEQADTKPEEKEMKEADNEAKPDEKKEAVAQSEEKKPSMPLLDMPNLFDF